MGQIDGKTQEYVDAAIADKDKDIRIAGLRLARRMGLDVIPVVENLVQDESAQVRRECAIALRHVSSEKKLSLWTELALSMAWQDRWYLESLGLALDVDLAFGWYAGSSKSAEKQKRCTPGKFRSDLAITRKGNRQAETGGIRAFDQVVTDPDNIGDSMIRSISTSRPVVSKP